jgi:hypothetical protein
VFTIYKRILLPFSIQLRGRGFEYSENNNIGIGLNNLEKFYESDQYSSWCKIKLQNSPNNRGRDFYGQANYFFQLPNSFGESEFPDYYILKHINFASVVTYLYDFNKITDIEILMELNSNDRLNHSHLNTINIINGQCKNKNSTNPSFIVFDEILSTEVLTFGFIDRGYSYKAIYPRHDFNAYHLEDYATHKENFIISLSDEFWQWKNNWYLAFIDGSPENFIEKESDTVLEDIQYEDDFWRLISGNKYEYW